MLTVDPKKRIEAKEVKSNPWVVNCLSGDPKYNQMLAAVGNLKKYQAAKKLKKAAKKLMAIQKMKKMTALASAAK
jgi:hypothetical protein